MSEEIKRRPNGRLMERGSYLAAYNGVSFAKRTISSATKSSHIIARHVVTLNFT
ncbi:MAG: hypothetical protein QXY07_04350 [Candidatus Bathyarchaeia archaeon]